MAYRSEDSVGRGSVTDPRSSHCSFPTTNWSEIERLVDSRLELAQEAFGAWANRYWRPLLAFFQAKGKRRQDAEDLAQDLVMHLKTREKFKQLQIGTNLRRWLKATAQNWLIDAERRERAKKRSPAERPVPIGAHEGEVDVVDPSDPEREFHSQWRALVIELALEATYAQCVEKGRARDYDLFRRYYVLPLEPTASGDTAHKPTWEELAEEFGLKSSRIASGRGDWVRQKLLRNLQAEIRRYVGDDEEAQAEFRCLALDLRAD